MEYIIDESGCRRLSIEMLSHLKGIAAIVSEIDSQNGTLKAALGDDYEAIARSVRVMTSELQNAYSELNVIIADMNEYMELVHQARIALE